MDQLSCQILVHAVAPEAQLGSLSPYNRHAATCALQSLRTLALSNPEAPAVDELLGSQPEALAALVQVYGIALREVAELGGAAGAAAVAPKPSETDFYSGRPPRRDRGAAKRTGASNSAAWAELLQCSAEVLGAFLGRNGLSSDARDSHPTIQNVEPPKGADTYLSQAALSALYCGDALPAVSRLLAAEVHRGRSAVLDTRAVEHVLWPLRRLVGSARCAALKAQSPQVGGGKGSQQQQQQQQEQDKPERVTAVLIDLADSDLVEHVCRYAVQRTGLGSEAAAAGAAATAAAAEAARTGQQAAQGQQEAAELQQGVMPFTLELVGEVCGLACAALKKGGPSTGAAEARAILSSAGLQVGSGSGCEEGWRL